MANGDKIEWTQKRNGTTDYRSKACVWVRIFPYDFIICVTPFAINYRNLFSHTFFCWVCGLYDNNNNNNNDVNSISFWPRLWNESLIFRYGINESWSEYTCYNRPSTLHTYNFGTIAISSESILASISHNVPQHKAIFNFHQTHSLALWIIRIIFFFWRSLLLNQLLLLLSPIRIFPNPLQLNSFIRSMTIAQFFYTDISSQ